MKRKLTLLIAFVFCILLCGCGKSKFTGEWVLTDYRIIETGEVISKSDIANYDLGLYLDGSEYGTISLKPNGDFIMSFPKSDIEFTGTYKVDGNTVNVYTDNSGQPFWEIAILEDDKLEVDILFEITHIFSRK